MASEASGAAGSLTGAVGAIYQGQAQSDALDRAALIQRQNAALDIEAGNENAGRVEVQAGQKIGQTEASFGAAGVTADSGSVLNVLAASAANMELDRQNVLHGAQVRAINYNNQASMDELGARSALQGSYMNALSSIAMGGSKIFGQTPAQSPGQYTPSTGTNESGYGEGEDSASSGGSEGFEADFDGAGSGAAASGAEEAIAF